MSAIDFYNETRARVISIKAAQDNARQNLHDALLRQQEYQEKREASETDFDTYAKSVEVLKTIIEKMSQDHLHHLTDLLTYGLQTIFYDRSYSVELEVEDKRNSNSAQIFLVETSPEWESPLRSSLEDSTGGSIRTVIGFILQIFYIGYFGLAPLMFIDEAFGSLSKDYIPTLVEFMSILSERKGFSFVMITHDTRIIPYASKVYDISDGSAKLIDICTEEDAQALVEVA